jgi:hypothetical protein
MNFIQSIRASHLNRHGFIDVLVSAIVLQAIYIALIFSFSSPENDPIDTRTISVGHIVFSALIIAPYFENLLLIGLASLHEKLFNRTGLFVLAPLLLTALHFIKPRDLSYPVFLRVVSLFCYFYIFLKQYDLHKLEMGKHKALLLSSSIHSSINASAILVSFLLDPDIAAETIFSAQPGD